MTTLGDVAEFLSGGTPKKGVEGFWGGDIPWFSAANMRNKFLTKSNITITSEGLDAGSCLAPQGATLLLVRGSGLFNYIPICFADVPVAFNQDVKAICAKPGIDPTYLHFVIESIRPKLKDNVSFTGIGAGKFDLDFLKRLPFSLIDEDEQRQVGRLAESFDRKIELNRRMNETLEAIARAIFKDWFVDFGPTRAKAEGRTPYLAREIWDLFPDALDDEDKPEGWRIGTVGHCFDLTMGQSPLGSTYNDEREGLPFFQGRTDFGFRYPENRKFCTAPTRIAKRDDTLVSVRAPVGDINMAWEKCCVGRGVSALRHKSGSRSFTYYFAWSIQQELKQYEHTGTVFGSINKKQFDAFRVVEPTPKIVTCFEKQIGPLDERIRKNVSESRTLAEIRDLLLPKLMSGKIRLREAEKAVETVI